MTRALSHEAWDSTDVVGALKRRDSEFGFVELWNAVPPGYAAAPDALQALDRSFGDSLSLAFAETRVQTSIAAAWLAGVRPEQWGVPGIAELPFVDTAANLMATAMDRKLSVADWVGAGASAIVELGELALPQISTMISSAGDLIPFLGVVVRWAAQIGQAIADDKKAGQQTGPTGIHPPIYTPTMDAAIRADALSIVTEERVWDTIFLPPYAGVQDALGNYQRWYLNTNRLDGGKILQPNWNPYLTSPYWPIADSFDNPDRVKSGYGCIPFSEDVPVHRALIYQHGFRAEGWGVSDAGKGLPQLATLGRTLWGQITSRGPSAFCVDGASIGQEWAVYLRRLIPELEAATGWTPKSRRDLAVTMAHELMPPQGIKARWDEFAAYQTALLGRVVVAYCDPAHVHPLWVDRIVDARRELLTSRSVCGVDTSAIPDAEYRAAVTDAKRQFGAQCFTMNSVRPFDPATDGVSATTGPSLEPLGEGSEDIPPPPADLPPDLVFEARAIKPGRAGAGASGGGGGGGFLALAAAAAVMVGLGARR